MVTCLFHGVAHNDQLNRGFVLHNNAVNPVDPGEQTVLVSGHPIEVRFLDPLKSFEVTFSHRLNDEVLVLAEEEETATLALRLASFENGILVVFG